MTYSYDLIQHYNIEQNIYIYIYTHTHTHTYIYIYICVCVYVCVCVVVVVTQNPMFFNNAAELFANKQVPITQKREHADAGLAVLARLA